MLASSLCLLYAGFMSLCLSMSRHYKCLESASPGARRLLLRKLGGWTLLGASLLFCLLAGESWSLGLVNWLGIATLSLLILVFVLAYDARKALWLAKAGFAGSVLFAAVRLVPLGL